MVRAAVSLINDPDQHSLVDAWEALLSALLLEAKDLREADRAQLAQRVLAHGGYESPDGSERDNQRARLAIRIADRLMRDL